jgi:CRP-like cAMP-binding protein
MKTLQVLKSLKLLAKVPEVHLDSLSEFLVSETREDAETVFEEGSPGDELYFIAEGRVRIAKRLARPEGGPPAFKDLAILGPGDCFGEMALIESVPRSADAIASGKTVLLRLARADLERWLKTGASLAMGFFAQLVQVLSNRLRRSSNELALLFDLSQILLEQFPSPAALLDKVVDRLLPHMDGEGAAGAFVYNEFNDDLELAVSRGDFASVPKPVQEEASAGRTGWIDERTCAVGFPGKARSLGHFLMRRSEPASEEERADVHRTLLTTARLIATAIENIGFRAEDRYRSRLKTVRQMGPF